MTTPAQRRQQMSSAAHWSWGYTVNRTARTANGRASAPGSTTYWEKQVRNDPRFANATDDQVRAAAQARKSAYFRALALRSAEARQRKATTTDNAAVDISSARRRGGARGDP